MLQYYTFPQVFKTVAGKERQIDARDLAWPPFLPKLLAPTDPLSLSPVCTSDGTALNGSKGPRQRPLDSRARTGSQKRSQHQVWDHYFLIYTQNTVHSCVCALQRAPSRGPPRSHGPSDLWQARVSPPGQARPFTVASAWWRCRCLFSPSIYCPALSLSLSLDLSRPPPLTSLAAAR